MDNIRPMTADDAGRVAEIHVFGQRFAYKGIVSDEHLFKQTTVHERTEYFRDTASTIEGYVFDDGIIKGFLTLRLCGDEDKKGALELYRIFVDPLMHGGGIGRQLLNFFEQTAKQRDFSYVCLWMAEGNPAGTFYEKMGYGLDGGREFSKELGATMVRYSKEM
ncbi:MAG: GNAT family N-acetyltransferase [Defluviitaleaceae bacterium]|nr:GNAT family N-acetyltransferase [Defluviitaleaceae bacterium]